MRVLYLTDSLSDLDGVGRYSMRLIAGLEELQPGFEARVLLARKHRPTSQDAEGRWPIEVALPPDYFFYMAPTRFWPSLVLSTGRAWRAARKVDLVHAIKDYPHNLIGVLAARLAGVPCVATAHGTYTVQPLLSERHRKLARWTYKHFASLISVSGFTRRRLLEVLAEQGSEVLAPERVHVVPNAVNAKHYAASPATIEPGSRPWHETPFVLSIAEVKERKGLHVAVEAWVQAAREHPDLRHFIVGNATGDEYHQGLVTRAREAGVADRQHFLGNIDEDEKIDLLQRAQVFIHTPVRAADGGFEGFGIVYLEASASGTPVIGTLHCGAEDAIRDGESGLLVEPTGAAAGEALRRILGEPELAARLAAGGRLFAAESSWRDNARRVLSIYRQVLGRSGESSGESSDASLDPRLDPRLDPDRGGETAR